MHQLFLENTELTPLLPDDGSDFRRRLDKAQDDYHAMRESLVRVEARFSSAETILKEKLSEVVDQLKKINVLAQEVQDLRINQREAINEHKIFSSHECELDTSVKLLRRDVDRHANIVKILSVLVGFLTAIAIPVVAGWLKQKLGVP